MSKRKILISVIFLTLGCIAFLSGYLLVFMNQGIKGQTGSLIQRFNNNHDKPAINSNNALITPINSRNIITFSGPSLSGIITAIDEEGNIIEIDTSTLREATISTLNKKELSEVILSPRGDSVFYSFYESDSKKNLYLKIKTNESGEINGEVRSVAFSPDSSQTAYLINEEGESKILIYKETVNIGQKLKTRINAATILWPSEDFISILTYNKNGYGDLFTLKNNSSLNKIISYQYNLAVRWSSSAEKIVFSAKGKDNLDHLFYKNIKNNESFVNLNTETNASKCVWEDEENIICGITDKIQLKDNFYRINIGDGSKELISEPNINLFAKKISLPVRQAGLHVGQVGLPHSGDRIFVLNSIDNKLYALTMDKAL